MKNKKGKTLQEVLKENQEKMWQKHLKEKKKQERNFILRLVIAGVLLVSVFYLGYLLEVDAMERCTQNHDYDYCLVNL